MPALIFRAVVQSEPTVSLLVIPLVALTVMLICVGIAYLLGRLLKLKSPTYGALILMSAVGNTGFIGYPLALELFGEKNFIRTVFYDIFGTVLFVFPIGILIAEKFGSRQDGPEKLNIAKEVLTFPPLLGLLAALVLRNFDLPAFVTGAVGFLAGAAIPLIMFTIGLSLEFSGIGKYKREIAAVSAVKLFISPLLALALALGFDFSRLDIGILVLEASAPVFLFSLILGIRYRLDVDFIPPAIVVSTMLSMLTIPIWQYALRALF